VSRAEFLESGLCVNEYLVGFRRVFRVKHWPVYVVFTALAWLVLFWVSSSFMMESPLDSPITLDPPGRIETEVWIVNPEQYELDLVFERVLPFDQLRSLIGAMGCPNLSDCPKGVGVPVHWSIQDKRTGVIIFSGTVDTLDSAGWSARQVYRHIGDITVPVGTYVIKAEVLQRTPELSMIPTHIVLSFRPKFASTWQSAVVFWGSLIVTPIACVALALASILLVFRLFRFVRSGRAQTD
jgi:hypothetical protein